MKISKKQIIVIMVIFIIGLLSIGVIIYVRREVARVSFDEEGYGPGINTSLIQNAIKEKKKLIPFFPFEKQTLLSTGIAVSIVVPSEEFQHNAWTTTVQIFGIDYDIASDDPEYEKAKSSFLEASNIVFDWMKSYGVDPKKIIINWGDKTYIQKQVAQWLSE